MATSRKRNVEIEFIVDDKSGVKSLKNIENQVSKTGQTLSNMAKAAALGFAADQIVDFARDSVRAFSDLEQSMGGTEAVFGTASRTIDKFADSSAEAMGLAESEFRTATTLIGGQLKRMTGDVQFAADQSIFLTQVASDLAATYGGTTAEAVAALAAAFRGEADPAERFNLNLKASAVNAKAVELGLAETTSKVDENAKAQAILALVTEQSADAQGQFARESDTLAGSMQIAAAEAENAKAAFGENLAPAMSEVLGIGTDLLVVMNEISTWMGGDGPTAASILGDAFQATFNVLTAGLIPGLDAWAESIRNAEEEQRALEEAQLAALAPSESQVKIAERADEKYRLQAEALELVAGGFEDAFTAQQIFVDAQKEAADPAFKLLRAIERYDDAQDDYTEAVTKFGHGSDQAAEAASDLAGAQLDLNEAGADFAADGGADSIEAIEDLLTKAGVLPETIQAIIDKIKEYNDTPITRKEVFVPGVGSVTPGTGGVIGGNGTIIGFADGGVVPGPKGAPMPALVHGGELILNPEQQAALGMTGGSTIYINALSVSDTLLKEAQEMARRQ